MGTYTTNKNLFMPSVGETGWGELVNGNFSTIDTFLKPISLSGSTYTFTGNHVGNQSGGSISATSISNSGTLTQTGTSTFTGKITGNGGIGTTSLTTSSTITSTGKITGNGGIAGGAISGTTGTFSGNVTAKYVNTQAAGNKYVFTAERNFIFPYYARESGTSMELIHRGLYFSLTGSTTTTLYLNTNSLTTNSYGIRVTDAEVKSGSWSFTIAIEGTSSSASSGLSVTGKLVCNGTTVNLSNASPVGISLATLQNILKYPSTITLTANGYANSAGITIYANTSSSGYIWLI